jgi:uncharacterized membrane protein (DUF373 family)
VSVAIGDLDAQERLRRKDQARRRGGSAEARGRSTLEAGLRVMETTIYVTVALLLVVAAGFTLVGTVTDVIEGSDSRPVTDTGVFVLERVLLVFIIAELLYTLRLVNFGGRILVEPFLFIGLIAIVRRVLVITAEVEHRHASDVLLEIGVLGGLAFVLSISIYLLRSSSPRTEARAEDPA